MSKTFNCPNCRAELELPPELAWLESSPSMEIAGAGASPKCPACGVRMSMAEILSGNRSSSSERKSSSISSQSSSLVGEQYEGDNPISFGTLADLERVAHRKALSVIEKKNGYAVVEYKTGDQVNFAYNEEDLRSFIELQDDVEGWG